jgi:hypothetical protein
MGRTGKYYDELFRTFWAYRRKSGFDNSVFDETHPEEKGPPVFQHAYADQNVLVPPEAKPEVVRAIRTAIARQDRHKHFRSMRSSQALAQSVFAGLDVLKRIDALAGLSAEEGEPAFFDTSQGENMTLEHRVVGLREPRSTSADVFFSGSRRIAVEVKYGEAEFGRCSRPKLRPDDPGYERDHCDGRYAVQRNRTERCPLTERDIRYWAFVPELFGWSRDVDHSPCPLNSTYQIARNVLAACVHGDGSVDTESAHALVIYDARNPAFHDGGKADQQWRAALGALRYPHLLRRVSWQRVARHLAQFRDLEWLILGLSEKYGIRPDAAQPR